jgi:Mrp family chromosome partitioning ATPase
VAATILVPLIAVPISARQHAEFTSSASVLLGRQDVASLVAGKNNDPATTIGQGTQFTDTQSTLATVRPLLDRVASTLHLSPAQAREFRDSATAEPSKGTDIMKLTVTVGDQRRAKQLATTWAKQFIDYRHQLDTSALQRAATDVRERLIVLARRGQQDTELYSGISTNLQQLRSYVALESSNVTLVQPAVDAPQTAPRTVLIGIIALVLGGALGVALAFLRQARDPRVREGEEIKQGLQLPILGRLVAPRHRSELALLREEHGPEAEAHQLLGLSIRLANVHAKARIILFSSALQGEGKSTTTANLAIALARTGHSVALVDLDLHRPMIGRLFDERGYGITDVALGTVSLEQALRPIDIHAAPVQLGSRSASSTKRGSLEILTTGALPPSPAQFVAGEGVAEILKELAGSHDYVLVDAPPMLGISDAVSLATDAVDAIVLIGRLGLLTRKALVALAELVSRIERPLLGVVVTGAEAHDMVQYRYETQAPELDGDGSASSRPTDGEHAGTRSARARP